MKKYSLFIISLLGSLLPAKARCLLLPDLNTTFTSVSFELNSDTFHEFKTGIMLPDLVFNNVINTANKTVKLSDYRGKLILIDFWATWCAPCVRMIPRIDSLQKEFDGQLQIISVTREPRAVVEGFLERNGRTNMPGPVRVVADQSITNLFGNAALPHFAWISREGTFIRSTSEEAVNEKVIADVLKSGKLSGDYDVDEEIPLDPSAQLFTLSAVISTGHE